MPNPVSSPNPENDITEDVRSTYIYIHTKMETYKLQENNKYTTKTGLEDNR